MLIPLTAMLIATATPPRHLVYTYKVAPIMHSSVSQGPAKASFDTASAAGGGANMSAPAYDSNASSGTIAIDVVQPRAADGSGVFNVTVSGFNAGKPFMCAAHGDTGEVVCNADQALRPETLLLLRVIGPNFYSTGRVDSKKHWHVTTSGVVAETADFTVAKNSGAQLTIAMSRHGTQQQPPLESSVEGTVLYDSAEQIPTALHATLAFTMKDTAAGDAPPGSRIDIELRR